MGRFAPPSQKVQVDVRVDEVVLHSLERDVERRYQHVSEVRTDVESITGIMEKLPPTMRRAFGFEYRSRAELFGLPLLHITSGPDPTTGRTRVARGIVAIGDIARGVIAFGGVAYGVFACGGFAVGVLAIGGCGIGVFCLSGLALALVFACGGLALAPIAFGGLPIGYIAVGGLPLGAHANGFTDLDGRLPPVLTLADVSTLDLGLPHRNRVGRHIVPVHRLGAAKSGGRATRPRWHASRRNRRLGQADTG